MLEPLIGREAGDARPRPNPIAGRRELFRRAVEAVIDWLAPSGRLLFTVPLGYNPAVLEYLDGPSPEVSLMLFMRRLTLDNEWEQATLAAVRDCGYDRPFPAANAIAIVEARGR